MPFALRLLTATLLACHTPPGAPDPIAPRRAEAEVPAAWNLSRNDAIRIALERSKAVRIIAPGARPAEPMVIGRVDPEADPGRFSAEVMALVRSVDERYWALAEQKIRQWGREQATALYEEILEGEQAKYSDGSGAVPNVAESEEQFRQSQLDLADAVAATDAAELRLREVLGPAPADDRKIIPTTPPREGGAKPDWDSCLLEMQRHHPEILRQGRMLDATRARRLAAKGTRPDDSEIRRNEELRTQVVHEATHSLAKAFLEVDTNAKLMKTSGEARKAAEGRLEARRAEFERGAINIDRYLEAVSRWAAALALEGQSRARYNTAIAALEEAKGTLLDAANIAVAGNHGADGDAPDGGSRADADDQVGVSVVHIPIGPMVEVQLLLSHDHSRKLHRIALALRGLGPVF
jgi:hypothetical protein